MKKVREPATSRIHGQLLIGLVGALVVMSVVVLSGQELKHVPPAAPSYTVLYSFNPDNGIDGSGPNGVIRDTAGNLYGTTFGGGSGACTSGTSARANSKRSCAAKSTLQMRSLSATAATCSLARDGMGPCGSGNR